jgi:lipoprotein-anchoring transpeptidase ErfK/SrfK
LVVGMLLAARFVTAGGSSSKADPFATPELPASPDPALAVPTPVPLQSGTDATWATVRRVVLARSAPSVDADAVTRLETRAPEGTPNIVLVLDRRRGGGGRLWVHARLPVLPNDRTGWIPRDALGAYLVVHTRLLVDLRRFTATLVENRRTIFRARIGVGKQEWPTPTGEFFIRNRLTDYDSPFYGPIAFGTSARSAVLTDWPEGGFVGIHGTNQPELLPGRVSHGCIRMRNEDILELGRLMPVGTPVTIS